MNQNKTLGFTSLYIYIYQLVESNSLNDCECKIRELILLLIFSLHLHFFTAFMYGAVSWD